MAEIENLVENQGEAQVVDVVNTDTSLDFFAIAKDKFGRDIDEDYLINDYKAKIESANND